MSVTLPAKSKSCDCGDGAGVDHLVSQNDTPPGPRRERGRKALGAPLLGRDEPAKQRLVGPERLMVIATRLVELARQHKGCGHRQRRPLARHQGDAERRVSDKRHTAARPSIHSDLTDPIEVEVRNGVEAVEDFGAFPVSRRECRLQYRLLGREIARGLPRIAVGEDEKDQRPVVLQRRPADHPPGFVVDDVNVVVPRAVAQDLERGDAVAERPFERAPRTERQPADVRRQTVRSDDQVEVALA